MWICLFVVFPKNKVVWIVSGKKEKKEKETPKRGGRGGRRRPLSLLQIGLRRNFLFQLFNFFD